MFYTYVSLLKGRANLRVVKSVPHVCIHVMVTRFRVTILRKFSRTFRFYGRVGSGRTFSLDYPHRGLKLGLQQSDSEMNAPPQFHGMSMT